MMDTLDLIISLDMLSLPAALPVFNLVDAVRISSSVIVCEFGNIGYVEVKPTSQTHSLRSYGV